MELNEKYYENIAIKKSLHYDEIIRALDIVKKFIMREERIITGGMSIDYALKLKEVKGIYDADALPDYDFFSPEHHKDAYQLAQWLYRVGFRGISVINAMHPSTMKVRINFNVVADITYVPKHILEHIPTLRYRGFIIIHPHVQMIDQHRSLSFPYENAPREVINSRPHKDMKRYDLLYEQYPLRMLNIKERETGLKEYSIPKELLQNQCVTGFFALNYWVRLAKTAGFKTDLDFGTYTIDKDHIKYSIPIDSHGISLYSDNIAEVYKLIKSVYKPEHERFYNKFLDKLPRKIILDNRWELLENSQKVAAHKEIEDIYIANLQNVMMYLLVNYILLMKIKNIKRGYSFYMGYLQCRNLITWASNKYYSTINASDKELYKKFLPTAQVYGINNFSEHYIVSKHNFDIKNREKDQSEKDKFAQPKHVYDRDLQHNRLPRFFFGFNPDNSEIFNFNGEECARFV